MFLPKISGLKSGQLVCVQPGHKFLKAHFLMVRLKANEPCQEQNWSSEFPTRSDTNRALQMAKKIGSKGIVLSM